MSEYLFNQILLDVRKEVFEKYPHLNDHLSAKKLKVRRSKTLLFANINKTIILATNETQFLCLYNLTEEQETKESIFNILNNAFSKRDLHSLAFLAEDNSFLYPLGEKGKKIRDWKIENTLLQFSFEKGIYFDSKFSLFTDFSYEIDFQKPALIVFAKRYSPLSSQPIEYYHLSSSANIQAFIKNQEQMQQQMIEKEEELKNYLLSFPGCVQPDKNNPLFLSILGNTFFFSMSRTLCFQTRKELFFPPTPDDSVKKESLEEAIEEAKKVWLHYIQQHRIRHLFSSKA